MIQKIYKSIPNGITLLNLVSGILSIIWAFQGEIILAAYLVFLASIFDFLDGLFARLLNAGSQLGKELDSLADLISFGFAPAVIIFKIYSLEGPVSSVFFKNYLVYLPFLITVLSAIRLAKFNIDTRQKDSFIGLPTPANAIFFSSFAFLTGMDESKWGRASWDNFDLSFLTGFYPLTVFIIIFSALMVIPVPLLSLKIKDLAWKNNWKQYILILVSLILIFVFGIQGLPLVIIFYLIYSFYLYSWFKH